MQETEPRVKPLSESEWSEEVTELLVGGTKGVGKGRALNIFRTLAHHPKLLKRWLVFGNHVLFKSTIPARERELVILRTGWRCGSEYEFGQHTLIGKSSGLTHDEIVRLTKDGDAEGWTDADRLLIRAVDELHDDSKISDDTWSALSERWSTEQLLDLVFAVGQYTLVSMALNTLGVQLDDGVPGFPTE